MAVLRSIHATSAWYCFAARFFSASPSFASAAARSSVRDFKRVVRSACLPSAAVISSGILAGPSRGRLRYCEMFSCCCGDCDLVPDALDVVLLALRPELGHAREVGRLALDPHVVAVLLELEQALDALLADAVDLSTSWLCCWVSSCSRSCLLRW
jgi:hypothetical protein